MAHLATVMFQRRSQVTSQRPHGRLYSATFPQGDWLLAQKFMGVTTSYKYDPDGTLSVKMDGEMDNVRLLDQLATVREVDLYKNWAPFCDTSALLKRIDIVEMLVHFNTAFPGASR